jgi:hypothetical protein
MRNVLWKLTVLLLLGFCSTANSQSSGCTTFFNAGDVICSVGNCNGNIEIQTPMGGGGGFFDQAFSCITLQCCGQGNYPFCSFQGGICYWTKLKDPAVRQPLLELAQTQDVLVVSCKGNYLPLTAVLNEEPMEMRSIHRLPRIVGGGR